MKSEKYKRGMKILESIAPGAGKKVKYGLGEIAPDMVNYVMEFVFGEISARPGLDMKSREDYGCCSINCDWYSSRST